MTVKLVIMMNGANVPELFAVKWANNIVKDIIKMLTVQPNAIENYSRQRYAWCHNVPMMVSIQMFIPFSYNFFLSWIHFARFACSFHSLSNLLHDLLSMQFFLCLSVWHPVLFLSIEHLSETLAFDLQQEKM